MQVRYANLRSVALVSSSSNCSQKTLQKSFAAMVDRCMLRPWWVMGCEAVSSFEFLKMVLCVIVKVGLILTPRTLIVSDSAQDCHNNDAIDR